MSINYFDSRNLSKAVWVFYGYHSQQLHAQKKKKICNYFQHTPLSIGCSVDKSCPPLQPHEMQHARLPCPSLSPRVCSNSCPLSQWHHPTISSSAIIPFSSYLQSFPASGSFLMSQLFALDGQSSGASDSESVLPINIQCWFPLGLTGLIYLSKGHSRVFSNITVQKHQFCGTQLSLYSNSHIHTWLLEKP